MTAQRCDHHMMCGITIKENCADIKCRFYCRVLDDAITRFAAFKERLSSEEMGNCSETQSKKMGSARIGVEGAIKIVESMRSERDGSAADELLAEIKRRMGT